MAGTTNVQKTKTDYRKPSQRPMPKQPKAPSASSTGLGKVTGKEGK